MDAIGWLAKHVVSAAERPFRGALLLLALCMVLYLPGVLRLPTVDRTEAIWAETTRDMVERGAWLDPRYDGEVQAYRPIGTFWAEAAAATVVPFVLGAKTPRDIRVYRAPAITAVTLAVIALYLLASPLVGGFAALTAATLFAVAPLTVLVATLGIAEGLSLLAAVVAMLALLRLYAADADPGAPLAMLFWTALGAGMLVNALLLPILVTATLAALYAFDRDLSWLKRLRPFLGLPLALLIASPWLIVRATQDGTPFTGLSWREFLAALGGAQDMKLRAFPGTFVLALLLGFLPATALLAPAVLKLWHARGIGAAKAQSAKLARFLIAWPLGYLVYLEALSSKPGTYMVQTLFPALALAVALLVRDWRSSAELATNGEAPPRYHVIPWPLLAALFPLAVFAGVYAFTATSPTIPAALATLLTCWLFYASARDGRSGDLRRWAAGSTLAFAAFAVALLGIVLPSIARIWPAHQIADYVEHACDTELSVGIIGLREPSARLAFGNRVARETPQTIAQNRTDLTFVESRWRDRYEAAVKAAGGDVGTITGCIESFNAMRGCPLTYVVYAHGPADLCFDTRAKTCNPATMTRQSGKGSCD